MITPLLHHLDTIDSTNDEIYRLAGEGAPEGTVVVAKSQKKGRGRRGSCWLDEPGCNLLMSILLRPQINKEDLPKLSFVASLSVCEYLRNQMRIESYIKWPNDVIVSNKKIAGILVETPFINGNQVAIAGIGLNVNQAHFPNEIAEFATSIYLETERCVAVVKVANELVSLLLKNYEIFIGKGFKEISSRWAKYMWGIGKKANIKVGESIIIGTIEGIDTSGAMICLGSNGKKHKIFAADYVHIGLEGFK